MEKATPTGGSWATWAKRPLEITAIHWDGSEETWEVICEGVPKDYRRRDGSIISLYNTMEAQWIECGLGHWIIRGIKGEFYPCDPTVFDLTYTAV